MQHATANSELFLALANGPSALVWNSKWALPLVSRVQRVPVQLFPAVFLAALNFPAGNSVLINIKEGV